MPTECLFRDDSYLKDCEARVVALTEQGGIVLDRTVFYANSGGQPGDTGAFILDDGTRFVIADAIYTDKFKTEIAHVPSIGAPALKVGDAVRATIDWDKRYGRMKIHTALHLLSVVLPYPITGASVGDADGRADFDIPEAGLDKNEIATKIAEMIATDAAVSSRWISDAELEANPGLIKSMSYRDRKSRSAALRRHPCAQDRRNRRRDSDGHREKGQTEPPRAHRAGLSPERFALAPH